MKKVIIGAGPAGLYTAIKLHREGIRDIVVYDPRAGHYTRPGHLNKDVFQNAESGLSFNFWPGDKTGHIKDLERALYKQATQLRIKIENKRFLRLHEHATQPGVIIDNKGMEEFVEADYVFDCTGTRREVVAAMNHLIPDSPLKMTTITELPVRNHFLAYVKMDKTEWNRFQYDSTQIEYFPEMVDALSFAQSIIKLRAMGWKEFKYPRCYGMDFGKDKVCLYLHAPDNLPKEHYDDWVQTVLECYTKPISYKYLPPSPKPRFLSFSSSAQALQDVSYKGKNLPTVIALGDAQIDFDYYQAHGIKDGMKRIDALFQHMEAFENEIHYFDSEEYLLTINDLLRKHKTEVIEEAEIVKRSFINALETAQLKFRQALLLSKEPEERSIISDMLIEIDARQSYHKACRNFSECHNKAHQVVLTHTNLNTVIARLNQIQNDLIIAYSKLPVSFVAEHKEVQELLLHLAVSWKEVGNALFNSRRMPEAIDAYKRAMSIYNLDGFVGRHAVKEIPIYSNLTVVYIQEKLYSEAISAANTALSVIDSCSAEDQPAALQAKIIYNLIRALCAQAQNFLDSEKPRDAQRLHLKAKSIISKNEHKIPSQTLQSIERIINELQQRLPCDADRDLLRRSSDSIDDVVTPIDYVPDDTVSVGQLLSGISMFRHNTSNAPLSASSTKPKINKC
ncbi:FAD-dependent oxidoreductase [Legionella quateirensis]|uniref:FAD binding domain n=1 Tax=Legionella quateirensis TaxID=45072 RepID=A0A378KPY2_9GAMM|nr:hypothetical protein [Legionella quateirensis]KTD54774.1 FAD binding domain protein [Legionella quateirensis]STY16954.1 FAD binding domain [Legionella quateirensis]